MSFVGDEMQQTIEGGVIGGSSTLIGKIERIPIVVCGVSVPVSAAGPLRDPHPADPWVAPLIPLAIRGDRRSAAQKLIRLWGDDAFVGCAFGGRVVVKDSTPPSIYTPAYFTWVKPPPSPSYNADLTVEFQPQRADGSYVWLCLSMVDKGGVHVPIGTHHHFNVWPDEIPSNAKPDKNEHDRRDFRSPSPARGDALPAKSDGGWIDQTRLLKICTRPTLRARVDGKLFPEAHDVDVFSKQFHVAFPNAAAKIQASGKKKLKIPVMFEGINTSAIGDDLAMVPGFAGSPPGAHQSGGNGEDTLTMFGRYLAPAYVEVLRAYGTSHEGGWTALNTYDGPKLSFGAFQLMFGPTGGATPAQSAVSGTPVDFLKLLANTERDCFGRLFGRYGYRISTIIKTVTVKKKDGKSSTSTTSKVVFWRVPCCPPNGKGVPETADGTAFDPPPEWLVLRGETASVGFVGLIIQAFADDVFNRTLAKFFASKIDAEAVKIPGDQRTISRVAIALRDNFVRPGKPYKLDCESNPRDAWNAIFRPPGAPAT